MSETTSSDPSGTAAQESAGRSRPAARAIPDAMWDWHLATNHVLWNEAFEAAFGYRPEQVEPSSEWWIDHIHPDDRASVDQNIRAAIGGTANSWTGEYRFLRADGSYADVFDRGHIIRDESGQAVRMIGAMLDQTAQMLSHAALQRSEERYRELFVSIRAGFCVVEVDLEGFGGRVDYRVVEANPAFYEQTGFRRAIFNRWLRAAAPGRDLLAEARCYRLTRNLAFVRAWSFEDDPTDPVAAAQSAYMVSAEGEHRTGANLKPKTAA